VEHLYYDKIKRGRYKAHKILYWFDSYESTSSSSSKPQLDIFTISQEFQDLQIHLINLNSKTKEHKCKASTHLHNHTTARLSHTRLGQKNRNKRFQNCIKTQKQRLQNGLSTPFPRLKFLHLAKSKMNVS